MFGFLRNEAFWALKWKKYKNLIESANSIFNKLFVMAGIQNEVTVAVFSWIRTILIMPKEPLFGDILVKNWHVLYS